MLAWGKLWRNAVRVVPRSALKCRRADILRCEMTRRVIPRYEDSARNDG
jgi:hypothetical protein